MDYFKRQRPVWSGPGVALKILLFRVDLNVGIEDFRVLVHGCTTVVTGRHRIVVEHAVRGRLFGGKIAEHGELFQGAEEMRFVGGGRSIVNA